MKNKIELRKVRDFGELVGDTFLFIGENWKPLLKAYAIICGPVLLAGIIESIFNLVSDGVSDPQASVARSLLGDNSFLGLMLLSLAGICISITTFSYVSVYNDKGKESPSTPEVWGYVKYFFFRMLGANILLGILLLVGIVMCVVPGLYFWPILSIMLAIMVFENGSLGYAFDRGFKLIKDHWWTTFGAMMIIMIVVYAGMMAFLILMGIAGGVSVLLGSDFMKSLPFTITISVIQYLCQILTGIFSIVISLCYFSLVERKEGIGLMQRINKIGQENPETNLPDEDY